MSTIAVITGSRAEWGLLASLVRALGNHPDNQTLLFVTGSHLSTEHGETWRQIDYPITEKIPCVLSNNTPAGVACSMGLATIGFGLAFERHRPDLLVVLGDRYEVFAAVSAAHIYRIPCAHLHGGELTEGSYDDGFRHSITKMSHLHFTAAEEYRSRVIQLGEMPSRVFNVGALGCDGLVKREYRPPSDDLRQVILAHYGSQNELDEINGYLKDAKVISGSHDVECSRLSNSMPRDEYLKELADADAIIGNSSSGIIEAPALGVPTINVGDRQRGRLMADSIIQCPEVKDLWVALNTLYSEPFQKIMQLDYYTPYQGGNVAERIADLILKHVGKIEVNKPFYQE